MRVHAYSASNTLESRTRRGARALNIGRTPTRAVCTTSNQPAVGKSLLCAQISISGKHHTGCTVWGPQTQVLRVMGFTRAHI